MITPVDSCFVGGAKEKARRGSLRRNLVDDFENPVHFSVKFLSEREIVVVVLECGKYALH